MKILLIRTKGCEACNIAKSNIISAVEAIKQKYKKDILFEEKDKNDVDKTFLKAHRINDFPAVFFINDDEKVTYKEIGNVPYVVYIQWIKVHLLNI